MKKKYEKPQMEVVNLNSADIICTSGEGEFSPADGGSIGPGGPW